MKAEIGTTFYRVEYQGILTKHEIIKFKNDEPVYQLTGLTDFKDESWKLKEKPEAWATSNYSFDIVLDNKEGQYFESFEEAKTISKEKFEKEVNPNGDYRVARYFDDIFEAFVTGILSKKEARIEAKKFNSAKPRHWVSYSIRAVRNEKLPNPK